MSCSADEQSNSETALVCGNQAAHVYGLHYTCFGAQPSVLQQQMPSCRQDTFRDSAAVVLFEESNA